MKVWDLMTGNLLFTLPGHGGGWFRELSAVAVTPNSKHLIAASDDLTISVWDLATGQERNRLRGHTDWVNAVVVTPDGQHVVSVSNDFTLKVWHIESGTEIASFGADGWLYACAIAPDGRTIVTAEDTGRVHFLRLELANYNRSIS